MWAFFYKKGMSIEKKRIFFTTSRHTAYNKTPQQ